MSVYLKEFSTHTEYDAYINGSGAILPNVSTCTTEGHVHYNPYMPPPPSIVVAKFNVTDTSNPTPISFKANWTDGTSGFSAIEIDGVEQPSVVSAYTFNTTGEHTIKYTLKDPTIIGESAFYECSGLTSIDIPNSVTSIGNSVFQRCSGLTSIDIPSGVTSIGNYAFGSCGLTSINIPSGVTNIGASAFQVCSSLTSINIPSGVTSIGRNTFYQCSGLTSIDIPNSVTSIGTFAFTYCTSLTSCTIGSGITFIGGNAFDSCRSLTSVICNATTPPTLENNYAFSHANNCPIYVPSGSVDTYKAATNWSSYSSRIQAIP